jgi:hypothetical protein
MRWCASIGIALLALSHLAFANVSSAFAQAGSTGGTVGKQDKSVSGGEEADRPRAAPQPKRAAANTREISSGAACGRIVGTWNWPNGSTVFFSKGGNTGTTGQPPNGTWKCSGSKIIAAYNNGWRAECVLALDGNSMTITTNLLPGTYTATRKN